MKKLTTSEFIAKATTIHGDKYNYSKAEYKNVRTPITIICPEHGEFTQRPEKHLLGQGCPVCCGNAALTTKEWIERAKKVNGNKYNYSKVNYKTNKTKVCIICPEHGDFWQTPKNHLNGQECPRCAGKGRLTTELFVEQAQHIHKTKYNYSKVKYVNNKTKVCIICPEHGEFWQTPSSHLSGCGCPKCGGTKKLTLNNFIERAENIHNSKYDYSKVKYVNNKTKVGIICPEHGEFEQTPYCHLSGQGCPKCAKEEVSATLRLTTEEFIEKARIVHGVKYDYSKSSYIDAKSKVCIICPEHGEFFQVANAHLSGCGCPICGSVYSRGENALFDFVKDICNDAEQGNRTILNGKELDIYVPSKKLAVEYDGLYWHSEASEKDSGYHLWKTEECAKQDIRLIHIFEDEWLEKKDIVKSRLRSLFGVTKKTLYARKCDVQVVKGSVAQKFLEDNHIQGRCKGMFHYGLFYDDELVSLMTFGKMRQQRKYHSDYDSCYELLRFCSKLNTNVVGAAGRLLKAFLRDLQPSEVVSYADKRWSQGNLYKRLGFEHTHDSRPNYSYVVGLTRKNRFKYRKSELVKEGYNPNKSEHEIMLERGIYRIYDCGTMVFKLKIK